MSIFFEIHKDIPREGPGLDESTVRALNMLENLPQNPKILDIGCGPGMQTIALAKAVRSKIIGIDTHEPFLDQLREKIFFEGLFDQVEAVNGSMMELPFENNSFDLIWSEGAIYIMGFERGLNDWKRLLAPGGYLVVSEISWLHKHISEEARLFWETEYPDIKSISANIEVIENAGYSPIGHFILPEEGWWTSYYSPLQKRINELRLSHSEDQEANFIMDLTENEINHYEKYSSDYGYVFYLMRKNEE